MKKRGVRSLFHSRAKKLMLGVLCVLGFVAFPASDYVIDGLMYRLYRLGDDVVELCGYEGSPKEVNVPSTVGITYEELVGYNDETGDPIYEERHCTCSVKGIGMNAFSGCSSIETLMIPPSVENIGDRAFQNCTYLKTIELGPGITQIGVAAFGGCSALGEVIFPASSKLEKIGRASFSGCCNLGTVVFPSTLREIGDQAFWKCERLEFLEFPPDLQSIGELTFRECNALKEIHIPSAVVSIGEQAFAYCEGLVGVAVDAANAEIGEEAFRDCPSLSRVSIGAGVTKVGDMAFAFCPNLLTVEMVSGQLVEIGYWAFGDCSSITAFTIPNSVKTIGGSAFAGCLSLKKVVLPSQLEAISESMFAGCEALKNVNIPSSINCIDDYAFEGCSDLTFGDFTVPSGVTYIGWNAFAGCGGLKTIRIPSSVETIGEHAFGGCSNLAAVNVAAGNKDYASVDGVLYDDRLKLLIYCPVDRSADVAVPAGVVEIGEEAFYGCGKIRRIDLPSSLQTIGYWAFAGCTSLQAVTIPEGVRTIPYGAFVGCSSLAEVNLGQNVEEIEDMAFSSCSGLANLTVPKSVVSLHENSLEDCTALQKVFFLGEPPEAPGYGLAGQFDFSSLEGEYPASLAEAWEAVLDNGYWHGMKMEGRLDGSIDLHVSNNCYDDIKLTWTSKLPILTTRYSVYRSTRYEGPFSLRAEKMSVQNFSDRSCSVGVTYYYCVEAENGIRSKVVEGKRVARIVDPKFKFLLTGSDYPETIGALGSNKEHDVLVAGHPFRCTVELDDPSVHCNLKNVRLIGTPSGKASKNRHEIVCSIDGSMYDKIRYWNWVKGKIVRADSKAFVFDATLKVGKWFHGEYSWSVECDYEIEGKTGSKILQGIKRPVYFEKNGIDNGISPLDESYCKVVPNWYAYWKEDGACPGLRNDNVWYRGRFDPTGKTMFGGLSGTTRIGVGIVILDRDTARAWEPKTINNPHFSAAENTLFTWDGERWVYGIYKVEDTVAHEWQHHATRDSYNEQIKKGMKDSDSNTVYCVVKVRDTEGMYALCEVISNVEKHVICDYIVDVDEIQGDVAGTKIKGLNPGLADTYGLGVEKWWEYGGYGDNELVSIVAGRNGKGKAKLENDWAYPGEQAGGIPIEAAPGYRRPKKLMASSATMEQPQDDQGSERGSLQVEITDLSARVDRDASCVTGLVYTIGVSIQGGESVEFHAKLFDSQDNVCAETSAVGDPQSRFVELFFDARDIFDRGLSGPYKLGTVELKLDDNNADGAFATLRDFAVDPIGVDRSELLCAKGTINRAEVHEVAKSGVSVSAVARINRNGTYVLTGDLVGEDDQLVASASVTNLCSAGDCTFALSYPDYAICQNGVSGICSVKNLMLWSDGELVDADATGVALPSVYPYSYFNQANMVCLKANGASGHFVESLTPEGKLTALKFLFDVTNPSDSLVNCEVRATLRGEDSDVVEVIDFAVELTNGVNRIEVPISTARIVESGIAGPYKFRSIEIYPRDEGVYGTTVRPLVSSKAYSVSDFHCVAEFDLTENWGGEGEQVSVRVKGGNPDRSSSVKVYLNYTGATLADLDLGKTLVNGEPVNAKTFKFPVTLKWAAGEVGEKTVVLKLKKDSLAEGQEFLTLQLGGELGMELGEARTCTVTIGDASANPLKATVKNPSKMKGVAKYDVTVSSADENAGVVSPGGSWYKGAEVTVKAKAKTGYAFSAWYDRETGRKVSTSASYTFTVAKEVSLEARFSKRYYVRALADPVDGATVTGSGWFAKGKTATLKAAAKPHFKFLGWYVAREDEPNVADETRKLSSSATYKPVVTNDMTVFACYRSEPRLEIFKTSGGSVTGANKYAKGKTATLSAKPLKGYAFLGWFDFDGNLVSQATTYKYKMGADGVVFNARFKKESELATPVLDWNTATNFPVGVSYAATPKVSGEVAVKIVSMSGLPAGLTFKSGKVSGAPTTAKTNTVSVKVALATNAKKTWTLKQRLVVEPLPAWVVGTFVGGCDAPANQTTLTVSSIGKVSGKVNFANAVWTLSGTKIAKLDLEEKSASLSLTAKKGTTKKTVKVTVGEDELGGYATSVTAGFVFEARQNLWKKDAAWAELAEALVGESLATTLDDLTAVFGASGAVTAKLKVGKNIFSCSSVFCPTEFADGKVRGLVYLYFAPNTTKKFKGAVRVVVTGLVPNKEPLGGVQLWEGGPYWATCNVGASKPEDSGYYFWWGDTVGHAGDWYFDSDHCPTYDKSDSELRALGYIDSTGNLAPAHDAATAHLGAPWRMPTNAEFFALFDNCATTWATRNGVPGRLVTGKGAYSSKSIFLPAAGCGYGSSLCDSGSHGYYWSSTPRADYSYIAWSLSFLSSDFRRDYYDYRCYGFPVRAVRGFAE